MSDGGKGSGRRPGQGYQDRWERIFGSKLAGQVFEDRVRPMQDALDRAMAFGCPPCNNSCDQGRSCPAREPVAPHCTAGKVRGKVQ